jgi:hypothetical protein
MKIISKEKFHSDIDYILKKDLLIPCFVYKIPIEISRDKELNFIEETIWKLIQVDDSLKHNAIRLSKMLGFYSETKTEDKTKIIQLILNKLKDLRIEDNNEDSSKVIIYQFYQEAYGNELLPLITKETNEFSYVEKDYPFKESKEYREISFKESIGSKNAIKAILSNQYNKRYYQPTRSDIIKTIYIHNQNKYQGNHGIDYKNFKIDMIDKPELMYLHTKLFIPRGNIESFVITNGFTNDFSTTLRRVLENKHFELLEILRQELRQDIGKQQEYNISIPFANQILKYGDIVRNIKNIEKNINILASDESNKKDVKSSKDKLAQSLYDVVETLFAILSVNIEASESLKNKELLNSLAEDMGFEVISKNIMSIFNVHDNDNFQKYLAKSLVYKKNELYEIALQYPNFLTILNKLFSFRNGLKHSEKEETLKKIDGDLLFEYKDMIYKVISIILKVEQKDINQTSMDNDNDIYQNHAYLDLDDEFSIDIINKLPQEVKDNLIEINYWFNGMEFNSNKNNIVNIVLNNIYSSLELLFRKRLDKLPKKASLGYIYNCLKDDKNMDSNDIKLVKEIVSRRGHGTQSMEDVLKITEKELKILKDRSFNYIKKLMEER